MAIEYGLIDELRLTSPIFYPRPEWSPTPPGATDHLIEVEPSLFLAARYYMSPSPSGTVLYFHGNGEVVEDYDQIAALYHNIGLDLFVVDYRGYGRSSGRPNFAALIADAHPVADRFHAIVGERGTVGPIFLMGRSLGAHPALELAARRPAGFHGLILESAAASLRRLIARFAEAPPANTLEDLVAAHEAKIATIMLPTLILHGERDEIIPLAYAEDLYDLMKTANRSLVIITGAGHNDILYRGMNTYFESIHTFVMQVADDHRINKSS